MTPPESLAELQREQHAAYLLVDLHRRAAHLAELAGSSLVIRIEPRWEVDVERRELARLDELDKQHAAARERIRELERLAGTRRDEVDELARDLAQARARIVELEAGPAERKQPADTYSGTADVEAELAAARKTIETLRLANGELRKELDDVRAGKASADARARAAAAGDPAARRRSGPRSRFEGTDDALRARIIACLRRLGEPASPSKVSAELGFTMGTVPMKRVQELMPRMTEGAEPDLIVAGQNRGRPVYDVVGRDAPLEQDRAKATVAGRLLEAVQFEAGTAPELGARIREDLDVVIRELGRLRDDGDVETIPGVQRDGYALWRAL